jgi:cholinesterase
LSGDYYTFSNIRYADPPQRFAKPQAPTTVNRTVNTGTTIKTCPNAYPWWLVNSLAASTFVTPQALGSTLYSTPFDEDCLFLDVFVPRSVYSQKSNSKAAVLVWIYGGGFTFGSKDDAKSNPAGLIAQSQTGGQQSMIVIKVCLNDMAETRAASPTYSAMSTH